jgi:hypothetical protein
MVANDTRRMAAAPAGAAAQMLELLHCQVGLYQRLAALGKTQQCLIAADDPQPLLKILAERQRITGELQEVAGRLRPLRSAWESLGDARSAADRRSAEDLIGQSKALLGRLIDADTEDAQRLRIRKQRTGEALRLVHANRQAVAAYAAAPLTSTRLDRTHDNA